MYVPDVTFLLPHFNLERPLNKVGLLIITYEIKIKLISWVEFAVFAEIETKTVTNTLSVPVDLERAIKSRFNK